MNIRDILGMGPVIPVLTIERADDAVPLARALVAGGIRVLEVTLRTATAWDAIARIVAAVPEAVTGVGTVTRADEVQRAIGAGAAFGVSPGLSPSVARAAQAARWPLLPGVMTPSELMAARELGFDALKLFPAEPAGGVALLRALAAPFPDVVFCPTGGVTSDSMPRYLELVNVVCVGGSWLTPRDAVAAHDWPRVTALARAACDQVARLRSRTNRTR